MSATCPTPPYWEQEGRLYGPDPMFVYPGDPHDHTGYGCYAPCIVQALKSALAHEGAADRFEVLDVSGETAAQLCRFIDEGMPVVFWATLDFTPVPEERDHWLLADGTDFAWKCNEHCLLLVGYDDENYWFNDPWHDHGVCAQPKELVVGALPRGTGLLCGDPAAEIRKAEHENRETETERQGLCSSV